MIVRPPRPPPPLTHPPTNQTPAPQKIRHEKHLKASAWEVNKGNTLLHAYLYRLPVPKRFNKVGGWVVG